MRPSSRTVSFDMPRRMHYNRRQRFSIRRASVEKATSGWSVIAVVAGLLLVAGLLSVLGACSPKRDSLTIFMSLDCTQCHSSANKFPVAGAKAGYAVSGHAVLGNSFYSNGGGCQRCHTHEGFVEYLDKGSIDPQTFVDTPSQPACFTCHDPHKTGDFLAPRHLRDETGQRRRPSTRERGISVPSATGLAAMPPRRSWRWTRPGSPPISAPTTAPRPTWSRAPTPSSTRGKRIPPPPTPPLSGIPASPATWPCPRAATA